MPIPHVPSLLFLIAVNGYEAYRNTVVGNQAPRVKEDFDRATHPIPGDLVLEITTPWRLNRSGVEQALGFLLRDVREEIPIEDPTEYPDGIPTERVFYIAPLDGHTPEVRWVNACFIAIHKE